MINVHPCMINKVSAHALMQPRMKGQRSAQCAMEEGECDGLQIDLGLSSRPELTAAGGAGAAEGSAGMTWLQAAEHVLREDGGPGMHIRDLTRTILELGIAKSSCSTSLETLLYRQTSKPASKFARVPGKMGWFGLRSPVEEGEGEEEEEPPPVSSSGDSRTTAPTAIAATATQPSVVVSVRPTVVFPEESVGVSGGGKVDGEGRTGEGGENWKFNPKVIYKKKKREGGASLNSASGSEDSNWSSSSDEESEALYHKRYVFTKKMAKGIIYDNVAMAEQLELIEQKIATAEAERQFLLEKFMKFSQRSKVPPPSKPKRVAVSVTPTTKTVFKTSGSASFAASSSVSHLARGPPPLVPLASVPPTTGAGHTSCLSALLSSGSVIISKPQEVGGISGGQGKKTGPPSEGRAGQKSPGAQALLASEHSSSVSSSSSESEAEATAAAGGTVLGAEVTDSKARGSRRNVGKVRRLHPIPFNDDGSPVLPIQIGGLTVHSLGKIVYDRVAYHTERYLLPVGFHSSRTYPSMLSPDRRTTYHCNILDGGDVPLFEMRAEDSEDQVRATSSTACQSIVLRAINKARDRQATNSGSGPEFFGYSNPTILNLLQKLPNAGRCSKYKFIKFDSPVRSSAATAKSKSKRRTAGRQQQKGEKPQAKKMRLSVSPRPAQTATATVSVVVKMGGGGGGVGAPTDPSLAPVLGSGLGQLGLEPGMGLYSSSEDWSSSDSGHELTVDL